MLVSNHNLLNSAIALHACSYSHFLRLLPVLLFPVHALCRLFTSVQVVVRCSCTFSCDRLTRIDVASVAFAWHSCSMQRKREWIYCSVASCLHFLLMLKASLLETVQPVIDVLDSLVMRFRMLVVSDLAQQILAQYAFFLLFFFPFPRLMMWGSLGCQAQRGASKHSIVELSM